MSPNKPSAAACQDIIETTWNSWSWVLTPAATLGSAVRAKGILLELRTRLPATVKKRLNLEGSELSLVMPADEASEFRAASAIISEAMNGIESLPVIPREIQDILTIKASERHHWLADGRLPSAGTRTVRLNGRARKITFHVFDPSIFEDLLDRGAADEWRQEDAARKAENRREAAYKAKLNRSLKKAKTVRKVSNETLEDAAVGLSGWEEFDLDGSIANLGQIMRSYKVFRPASSGRTSADDPALRDDFTLRVREAAQNLGLFSR